MMTKEELTTMRKYFTSVKRRDVAANMDMRVLCKTCGKFRGSYLMRAALVENGMHPELCVCREAELENKIKKRELMIAGMKNQIENFKREEQS